MENSEPNFLGGNESRRTGHLTLERSNRDGLVFTQSSGIVGEGLASPRTEKTLEDSRHVKRDESSGIYLLDDVREERPELTYRLLSGRAEGGGDRASEANSPGDQRALKG